MGTSSKPTKTPANTTAAEYKQGYEAQYGTDPAKHPSFQTDYQNNQDWYKKEGRMIDQGLVNKGYTYYEGPAGLSADQMHAAGYKTQGELGGTGANGYSGWYYVGNANGKRGGCSGKGGCGAGGAGIGGAGGGGYSGAKTPDGKPPKPAPIPDSIYNSGNQALGGPGKTLGEMGPTVYDKEAKGLKALTSSTPTKVKKTKKSRKKTSINQLLGVPDTGVFV